MWYYYSVSEVTDTAPLIDQVGDGQVIGFMAADTLIIVGKGDWPEQEYDLILDRYAREGWQPVGRGADWWDYSTGGGVDVFVMRMEEIT